MDTNNLEKQKQFYNDVVTLLRHNVRNIEVPEEFAKEVIIDLTQRINELDSAISDYKYWSQKPYEEDIRL